MASSEQGSPGRAAGALHEQWVTENQERRGNTTEQQARVVDHNSSQVVGYREVIRSAGCLTIMQSRNSILVLAGSCHVQQMLLTNKSHYSRSELHTTVCDRVKRSEGLLDRIFCCVASKAVRRQTRRNRVVVIAGKVPANGSCRQLPSAPCDRSHSRWEVGRCGRFDG